MQKGKTEVDSSFYQDLEEAGLSAFWKVIAPLQKGGSPRRGRIWRWDQVHPMLERAGKLVGPDQGAERRVLIFAGAESSATTTPTLTASVQMVLPGETAPSHRHTISAIRFVLSAKGAFTEVEGERIPMEPGDLIVTPAWSWHGHGNESREPAVCGHSRLLSLSRTVNSTKSGRPQTAGGTLPPDPSALWAPTLRKLLCRLCILGRKSIPNSNIRRLERATHTTE